MILGFIACASALIHANQGISNPVPPPNTESQQQLMPYFEMARIAGLSAKEFELAIQRNPEFVRARNDSGLTMAHIVVGTSESAAKIAVLHHAGADLNAHMLSSRYAPLHFTLFESDERAAAALLHFGALPNIQARNGQTPLHLVSIFRDGGGLKYAALLVGAGAQPALTDLAGRRPDEYMKAEGQMEVRDFLLAFIAPIGR
ncbi:MAG: hypothetical protein WD716_05575 [Fimbriimonadaceae bacterium]